MDCLRLSRHILHYCSSAVPATVPPAQAEAARVAYETGMQLLLALPGRNTREAVRQLRRSIALGPHRDALAALGYCYRKGWGFRRPDLQLARHWATLAAEAGSALGAHELAVQLESVDKPASLRWYAQAAMQMDELGQSALGLMKTSSMYRYGDGVRKDDSLSVQWLQRAVAAGDQASIYNLASCYYFGRADVPVDLPTALTLLRRSAQYDDPLAEGLLGDMYRLGTLVQKDDQEARRWYRRAAEHGSDVSQLNMGLLSMRNACDLREAVRWLRLAAQSRTSPEIRFRSARSSLCCLPRLSVVLCFLLFYALQPTTFSSAGMIPLSL
jgi:TPR repeat protein